eukprot:CAMPEP_0197640720 /NCGR_PEP_ID=MMETSP1338-20131121/14912_1 /TAXON_ID=43686 ORGANISM="Pelagodinium beii, Strain RCC1491" /NCGR_SAMPLE_ID=MMETSP1338 /ASSEMBLY_ACC=CAM_ASM_000754 /LENGTH=201 /DNA_ID=CAMNT_0043213591 /DNA_START=379 /DNA_END=985 /DNA_ORIENTATION=+
MADPSAGPAKLSDDDINAIPADTQGYWYYKFESYSSNGRGGVKEYNATEFQPTLFVRTKNKWLDGPGPFGLFRHSHLGVYKIPPPEADKGGWYCEKESLEACNTAGDCTTNAWQCGWVKHEDLRLDTYKTTQALGHNCARWYEYMMRDPYSAFTQKHQANVKVLTVGLTKQTCNGAGLTTAAPAHTEWAVLHQAKAIAQFV